VLVQNRLPGNHSQLIALYNDAGLTNLTLSIRALYNTFVGADTNAAFVHVSNADGTRMTAEISDNIISGTKTAVLIESAAAATVTGMNNWLQTNASAGPLTASVRSATPGFRNPAGQDYTLTPASACVGVANATVFGLPGREYFLNEVTRCKWRIRASARDLGAFESTSSSAAIGPYDPAPLPLLSIGEAGNIATIGWPLFAQDFRLYQSDLANPIQWNLSLQPYVTNADGLLTIVPSIAGKSFFRLSK